MKKVNLIDRRVATLQDIVDQLEFCEYQTGDGLHALGTNVAFVELKRRAAEESRESSTDD